MDVADELCDELFCWIDQQELCADNLMALATELEGMRKVMTKGQLVGNTAIVLGSVTIVGTGIATFLTGGLTAPLLVKAAVFTAGAGTATSFTLSIVEEWKYCKAMKYSEKTADQITEIQDNIEKLQEKLEKECERQVVKVSSSDEVQCEITVRILRAMAKRSGKDLSLSHLRRLLRSDDMHTDYRYPGFNPNNVVSCDGNLLHAVLALSFNVLKKKAAKKGAKYSTRLFVKATAVNTTKSVLKGAGQVTGGVLGMVFTVPDLINNCEELIKSNHQTEASIQLKTKANEIREAVNDLKKQLKELEELLNQIPEI